MLNDYLLTYFEIISKGLLNNTKTKGCSMNILHIHKDYPDGSAYPYTLAVDNLIRGCQDLKPGVVHTVLSINRTFNPFKVAVSSFEQGISVIYWAVPLPYLYHLSMKLSAYYIFNKIRHLKVDVIHGHKLTCEGVFSYYFSNKFNVPYVLSIRGGSDQHNLCRLSAHHKFFERVYKNATQIFWVSAWASKKFASILNVTDEQLQKSKLLPNICDIEQSKHMLICNERESYVTALSFHQYKRKGILELIQAIAQLKHLGVRLTLDIYGTGPKKIRDIILQKIEACGLSAQITLRGQVSQQVLREHMASSKGFLMPATNETFGMAYVEALSVGCPILYIKNTGIDGYFDHLDVGIGIGKQDVGEIKAALEYIELNNRELCQAVSQMVSKNFLADFTLTRVVTNYINTMGLVCSND
jgi:glycosyltransferase involved in cell wall biosynthesis